MSMDFDFDTMFANSSSMKSQQQGKPYSSTSADEYYFNRTKEELEKHRDDKKARRERFLSMMAPAPAKNQIEKPVIDNYIKDGKQVFQQLFLRFNKVSEDYTDNVDLKPVPKGLRITKDDKWQHVELIRDLFDEEKECEESQLKMKRLDKNKKIQEVIRFLELRSFQHNSTSEQSDFSLYKEEFFKNFNGWKFDKYRVQHFQQYQVFDPKNSNPEILKILNYKEKQVEQLRNIFITYITSGGGKTTLFKKYKSFINFLDVDEFIKKNFESFQQFQNFSKFLGNNNEGIMTLWFKYKLDEMYQHKGLDNVILLFNHPNQVPNYFRRKYNELIIMPEQFNWEVRFFQENYFSLACVLGKHKVVLKYDLYLDYILEFFQVWFSPIRIRKLLKKEIYGLKPVQRSKQSSQPAQLHQLMDSSANNKRLNSWLNETFVSIPVTKRNRTDSNSFNLFD